MLKRVLFSGSRDARSVDLGMLLLRVFIGCFLAFGHGMGKLTTTDDMAGYLQKMNVPLPHAAAWAATLAEFLGGILLALGLLTRPAAFFIAFTMLVAVSTAHRHDPLFMNPNGAAKEPALLFMMPAVFFLIAGSGRYGVDALIRRNSRA
jgi:putative oxidoreductase